MPDAVVIGAGPNGLVAANLLADAGWSVEVLEAQQEPGGAVRSDRGVHPDYVSDLFSAFYPLAAASPVLARLDLAAEGLRWSHAPRVLAHPLRVGRCAVLERRVQETASGLDRFASGDGDAWQPRFSSRSPRRRSPRSSESERRPSRATTPRTARPPPPCTTALNRLAAQALAWV